MIITWTDIDVLDLDLDLELHSDADCSQTLTDEAYQVSGSYFPAAQRRLHFDDPEAWTGRYQCR